MGRPENLGTTITKMDASEILDCDESLTESVLTAATAVHRELGPGLLESVYEQALMLEFEALRIPAQRQVEVPVVYKGTKLGIGFRADIVVAGRLLLELKSVESLTQAHIVQAVNYLRLLKLKRGFLLNFNKPLLKQGIKRISL